ncbi:MAG: glycosyltransferase family 2 protein [Myxococcota bacterium]
MASVSVIVPVYNSEASLDELVGRLVATLEGVGDPFEICLVNDGSRDGSWAAIARLAASRANVRGIDLMRNFGQHNALLAGILAARHDVIVTLDDDLQHPPEAIPLLLKEIEAGADVVYGTAAAERHGTARNLASRMIHWTLSRVLGPETERHSSSFRAFRSGVRAAFADYRGAVVTVDALLTWGAARFAHVEIEHAERRHGRSNYTLGRLIHHAYDSVTNFSVRPLKFASLMGFVITAFGFAATCYAMGFYTLRGLPIPPDVAIFSAVCLFSGIQLVTLGIMGEYLARMHVRLMEKPPFVIRCETDDARRTETAQNQGRTET